MKNLLKVTSFSFFLLLFSVQSQNNYGAAFSVPGFPAFKIQVSNKATSSDFGVYLALDTALLATDALQTLTLASSQVYLGGTEPRALLFQDTLLFNKVEQPFGVRLRLGLNF